MEHSVFCSTRVAQDHNGGLPPQTAGNLHRVELELTIIGFNLANVIIVID
jgi:hypothetical protein